MDVPLRWRGGALQPDAGASGINREAQKQWVEARFLELLAEFELQGRYVTNVTGSTYAPTLFAAACGGEIGKAQFKQAMERLFAARKIAVEHRGPPSRRRSRIVEAEAE